MSASFEFEVEKNLALNEGSARGYFAVQAEQVLGSAVAKCLYAIEKTASSELCIPVVTDEFGMGGRLKKYLASHNQFASLITFGSDENSFEAVTHTEVMALEVGLSRSDFLAVQLRKPTPISSQEWRHSSPLSALHLRYGSVVVKGQTCILEADESIEPLVFKW